jgi:AcrR family transcriptional regulator
VSSEVLERNARQQQTVDRLLAAGAAELAHVGADRMTVRTVAAGAGVSSATAYTYFTSRDHLVAELFLRHLETHPAPAVDSDVVARLQALLRAMADDLAASPALAAAATKSLLGSDPAVDPLRTRIGQEYAARLWQALTAGPEEIAEPDLLLETLLATVLGMMLQAGMGALTYVEMGARLEVAVAVIMRGHA